MQRLSINTQGLSPEEKNEIEAKSYYDFTPRVLSVDPGIECGIVEGSAEPKDMHIYKNFIIKSSCDTWLNKLEEILYTLKAVCMSRHPEVVLLEYPSFFQTSKGMAAASSGKLVKLCMVVGSIMGMGIWTETRIVLVEVNKWKGQLSKKQVEDRIKRIYNKKRIELPKDIVSHQWDALGILLWWKGLF